jgi:hypothetical protein
MEYYSTTKKNEILLFTAKWMEQGGTRGCYVNGNKPDRERHILSYMWKLKNVDLNVE